MRVDNHSRRSRPQFEVRCARSAEFDEVRDLVLASLRERGDFRDGDKEPVMVLNGARFRPGALPAAQRRIEAR